MQVWLVLIALWAAYIVFNTSNRTEHMVFKLISTGCVAISIVLVFVNGGTTE